MNIVVCLVTCPNHEVGTALARMIVDARLAACVNQIPGVQSVYRWKDEVCIDQEELLVIKTADHLLAPLRAAITEQHPYDVPEFVVLAPQEVSAPYAEWLRASVLPIA